MIIQNWPDKEFLEQQEFGFPHKSDAYNWDLFHKCKTWEDRSKIQFNDLKSF